MQGQSNVANQSFLLTINNNWAEYTASDLLRAVCVNLYLPDVINSMLSSSMRPMLVKHTVSVFNFPLHTSTGPNLQMTLLQMLAARR